VGFDGLTFYFEDYGVGVPPLVSLDSGRLRPSATGDFFGSSSFKHKDRIGVRIIADLHQSRNRLRASEPV